MGRVGKKTSVVGPLVQGRVKEDRMSRIEEKIKEMGLVLPAPRWPDVPNFVPWRIAGDLVFIAGHVPFRADGTIITGKLGDTMAIEEGYQAARLVALSLMGTLKGAIGDLDRVSQFLKLHCMVNSTPDFPDHPRVANGASDFIIEVFGERGRHTRAAIGMANLPGGACIEIEMQVQVQG